MTTFDQARFLSDIEQRTETIRRQAETVLAKIEGSDPHNELRPRLEGMLTNTSHILNDLGLLKSSLDIEQRG